MREKGTIKFFDLARGFGFILRGSDAPDAYLHASKLRDPDSKINVFEGVQVEFRLQEGTSRERPTALDVTVLG